MKNEKESLTPALQAFQTQGLRQAALGLFESLGYNTRRQAPIEPPDFDAFSALYLDEHSAFNPKNARTEKWLSVDLLFQFTADELSHQLSLFEDFSIQRDRFASFLFFCVELKPDHTTRTELSAITREINRPFRMPVLVLFKIGDKLTLAVIHRRPHKRDGEWDVLEKVTLIKDIDTKKPHRGHIEILWDLSLPQLPRQRPIAGFDDLHEAWKGVLDTKELNKRFYRELFNWYLWAKGQVKFPQIRPEPDQIDEKQHQSESLIRLLTRLLFVWFMKEKGLIPEELFQSHRLERILKGYAPQGGSETVYYKAILQNLFFATLNTPIEDRKPIRQGFNPQEHGNPLVYRYAELFAVPDRMTDHFRDIPFLNGGLFDCLDQRKTDKNPEEIRLDGFSVCKSKQPTVPDRLFFGEYPGIDLSGDYDDKKQQNVTVHGLIDILSRFKFTIEENTPIEQEVALDPELLGRVFENLLASYNPETQTTARKRTGSFYTPREIVDYMVDESLKAYLKDKLLASGLIDAENADIDLAFLFEYNEKEHLFDEKQRDVLIDALDRLRLLDPACGSGAFPMGALQKMIHILHKLDPDNKFWFEKVIAGFPEYLRGEMRRKLEGENWNYVRKLGIISQCLYGVDIQPIATQIAKLRFFISLLVDQRERPDQPNRGLDPLPNLDFKIVTADSLIRAPKEEIVHGPLFTSEEDTFFSELANLTGRYFSISTPKDKQECRQQICDLIEKKCQEKMTAISKLTQSETRSSREKAHLENKHKDKLARHEHELALWQSYPNLFKHEAVKFFEPRYFFPKVGEGFDIVIGNPPYVQIQNFSGRPEQAAWDSQDYETYARTGDVYCLFYERGHRLLAPNGTLCYITSNKWMRANYGKALRKFFMEQGRISGLIDFGDSQIFEAATTYTNVLVWRKGQAAGSGRTWDLSRAYDGKKTLDELLAGAESELLMAEEGFVLVGPEQTAVKRRIEAVGTPLKKWDISIYRGILTGLNEAFIIDGRKRTELIAQDPKSAEIIKPILRGRDIKRYKAEHADLWLLFIPWHFPLHENAAISGNSQEAEKAFKECYPAVYNHLLQFKSELSKRNKEETGIRYEWYALQRCAASYYKEFEKEKIVWLEMSPTSNFTHDLNGYIVLNTAYIMTGRHLKYLSAVINSKVIDFYFPLIATDVRGQTRRYIKQYVENLPIPKASPERQIPFEILVDGVLFAKEKGMEREAELIETVIDGLVYDLYFEEEMRAAHCFVTERLSQVLQPFKPEDTDEFKTEYILELCRFFEKDETVRHALVHRSTVPAVRIITGEKS